MKKRIISFILSAVTALSSCSMLFAGADDSFPHATGGIWEDLSESGTTGVDTDYTFDELLTMNKEEICGISDAYAEAYHCGESALETDNRVATVFTVYLHDDSPYLIPFDVGYRLDENAMLADLSIPRDAVDFIDPVVGTLHIPNDPEGTEFTEYQGYQVTLPRNGYNGYIREELFIRLFVALSVHPKVAFVEPEIWAGPDPNPTPEESTEPPTVPSTQEPTDAAPTESQTAAASSPETTPPAQTSASPQTTAPAQTSSSSPKTGDDGVSLALGLAALSLVGCAMVQKKKKH